jgi:glycosyltransferase involved in cell wall biosynthesis
MQLADRALLRRVDHYFAVSERLARYAVGSVRVPAHRCERLPNGVAVPPGPVRHLGGFTITQVARLFPEKQQLFAIEIAARLRDRKLAFQWQLVGSADGSYAQACRTAIARRGLQDQVRLLGERSDVAALLAEADVGVLTSRFEALPVALLEYMAAGLPVVVTDVGDCGATVRGAGGGLAIASGDVDGFAEQIEVLAVDGDRRRAWGSANREYVRQHHSVEAMVRRVELVYDALLGLTPAVPAFPESIRP